MSNRSKKRSTGLRNKPSLARKRHGKSGRDEKKGAIGSGKHAKPYSAHRISGRCSDGHVKAQNNLKLQAPSQSQTGGKINPDVIYPRDQQQQEQRQQRKQERSQDNRRQKDEKLQSQKDTANQEKKSSKAAANPKQENTSSKGVNATHIHPMMVDPALWQTSRYSKSIAKKTKKILKNPRKSLDEVWSSIANLCLFSYKNDEGREIFVSSEDTRNLYGQGHEGTFCEYPIFVPDAIINRVTGKIGKAKNKSEVLVAYIDGSHSFDDKSGCCAYSVFFQVGSRIAEYANTVCDDDRRYGATAAELMAAIVAIKVAIANGYRHIELRHDYTGVAFFSDDSESFPNKRSKMYWVFNQYEAFLHCAEQLIDITYTKVKSHSLDIGNEHADFLARTFSKRARIESDKTLERIQNSIVATQQMIAFAKANDIEEITFASVETKMEETGYQEEFGFDEVEMNLIKKMLRDTATEEIMRMSLLSRKQLSERRRSIIVKLGMPADAAADNTIVKRTLNWLYLGKLNPKRK